MDQCQFHGCAEPQAKGRLRKGWGFCKGHQEEYDYLMHHAERFDLGVVDDFWRRAYGGNMIHVVCLKHGTKYDSTYVNRLYNMVLRNTTHVLGQDFDFTCFTDDRAGIDPAIKWKPLPRKDLEGWWHKLWFFSPEFAETVGPGQVLYYDLDTVITGNVDPIFDYDNRKPLAILRDVGYDRMPQPPPPEKANYGSALLSWQVGWGHFIWERFSADVGREMRGKGHGDQGYIKHTVSPQDVCFWQDYLPTGCRTISYKWGIRDPDRGVADPPVPKGVSVVLFHGVPRPHEVTGLSWMQEHWK